METYLKCLLKCVPRVRICDAHLKPVPFLYKHCKPLGVAYAKVFTHSMNRLDAEYKDMYAQARLFIAYDGALEGGRDQDWWFKQCADRWEETAEYWAGKIPMRVSYLMSLDDPMRYPLAYVYWQNRLAYYSARKFVSDNKYWILATIILGVL